MKRTKRSFFSLIGDIPGQILDVIRAEALAIRATLLHRLRLALSSLLFLIASLILGGLTLQAFLVLGVLLLALVLPLWAAFLILAVFLSILTSVCIALSAVLFSRARNPSPLQIQAEEIINAQESSDQDDSQLIQSKQNSSRNSGIRRRTPQSQSAYDTIRNTGQKITRNGEVPDDETN